LIIVRFADTAQHCQRITIQ